MSYRSFKKLLGENNLERKCRILLGGGTLVLMTFSFWLYARQTEDVAFGQTVITGQLLVPSILAKLHTDKDRQDAMREFQSIMDDQHKQTLARYTYRLLKPKAVKPENKPEGDEATFLNRFVENPSLIEDRLDAPSKSALSFFYAIRASKSCIECHNRNAPEGSEPLKDKDLMAVMVVRLSTEPIEEGIQKNRAFLISNALVTALLIVSGAYLIIRYVIVKPVKHLKDVSDAIAAGQVNVRSDIQTGDEFEDLSDAFNKMLRKLMSMQEESQQLNADLDRKVDELAHTNMALHQSDRIKGDFLATMSHELRTPLNSILGFSDVLLNNASGLNEKQARWISNIKSNGQQLLKLITDILDLAKIEAGKVEVRAEDISLSDLAESLMAMFRPLAERKRIEMLTRYETPLPIIKQDGVKLRQILSNLLSNAVKFSPEAGRVVLSVAIREGQLTCVVKDDGIGIAAEDQDAIFEKFRQSGDILTREHEGSGLGLSIVHELCKMLGGSVMVKSELGRGSAFTVVLPTNVNDGSRYDFILPRANGTPARAREPV